MAHQTRSLTLSTPPLSSNEKARRFATEEWEGWMKWDNALDPLSPKGSDHSPPSLQFPSGSNGSSSPSELDSLPPVQFSPVYHIPEAKSSAESKKRKSAAMLAGGKRATTRQPRGQKISHNVIEKRYRSNLNDKIAKLRDSVPELRTAAPSVKRRAPPKQAAGSDSEGSDDGGSGLRFNKATVLTKATEYIQQLERQNKMLQAEMAALKNRVGSGRIEKLRNPPAISTGVSTGTSVFHAPDNGVTQTQNVATSIHESSTSLATMQGEKVENPAEGLIKVPDDIRRLRSEGRSSTEHYAPSPTPENFSSAADGLDPTSPMCPVVGLIPVPEEFRRLREQAVSQDHYAPQSSYYSASAPSYTVSPQDTIISEDDSHGDEGGARWPRSKALSRILVGSLAGLMLMEGLSEKDESSDGSAHGTPARRGLFALPSELLTESRGFRAPIRQRIIAFAASPAARRAPQLLLISALFMVVCFGIFVYLAPRGSKATREGPVIVVSDDAAAAAAPIKGEGRPVSTAAASPAPMATNSKSPFAKPPSSPHPPTRTVLNHPYYSPSQTSQDFLLDLYPGGDDGSATTFDSDILRLYNFSFRVRQTFDRLAVDWLGLSWLLRAHHLDEEAGRRFAGGGGSGSGGCPTPTTTTTDTADGGIGISNDNNNDCATAGGGGGSKDTANSVTNTNTNTSGSGTHYARGRQKWWLRPGGGSGSGGSGSSVAGGETFVPQLFLWGGGSSRQQ